MAFWSTGSVVLLVGLGTIVFAPGLGGWFLLDDLPVLGELNRIGFMPLHERLRLFVFGGETGPLGRPLAMASFLLNDYAWPTDPAPFKYTNLCIHLIVGLLVYWFLLLLTEHLSSLSQRERQLVAFCTAIIWLIHPLQTSSVLYVVQRMNLLSGLFVISGLVLYLKGRLDIQNHATRGYILMSAGIVSGTGLGMLCKENAVLLPVYALVCEYTLVRSSTTSAPRTFQIWAFLFLWLPVIGLLYWHISNIEVFASSYGFRAFTMAERLYTEPRVLFMYLHHIFVPQRQGTGLFHDDIAISKGLADPATTAIAIAVWLFLVTVALYQRKQWPVVGFSLLWFLGGHALEAGPLSLELYFEHRNYLPMIGPLIMLGYGAHAVTPRLKRFAQLAMAMYLGLAAYASYQNAVLWRNIPMLAWNWAEEHPNSPRAQMFLANQWALVKRYDAVESILVDLMRNLPRNTGAPVNLVQIRCLTGNSVEDLAWDTILSTLAVGEQDTAAVEALALLVKNQAAGKCLTLTDQRLVAMLESAISNPSFRHHGRLHATLHYTMGEFFLYRNDPAQAIEWIDRAFGINPSVEMALKRARLYTVLQRFDEARDAVREAARLDRHTIWGFPLHSTQIAAWERFLKERTASQKQP